MKETLSSLISAVNLQSVRTVQGSFRVAGTVKTPGARLEIKTDTSAELAEGRMTVLVRLIVTAPEPDGAEPLVSVSCTTELLYGLPPGFTTDLETAREFARVNGAFNAWPFARAFVHASFTNMGLPPFTLPVLRLKDMLREPPSAVLESPKPEVDP